MPIARVAGQGKGPDNPFRREAGLHVGIRGDIDIVVVTNKRKMSHLPIGDKREDAEQKASGKSRVLGDKIKLLYLHSMNSAPQPVPVAMPVRFMFHRGLFLMSPLNDPSFLRQICKSQTPARPLTIGNLRIGSFQMPASSMEIEPRILMHYFLPAAA
jgi:hypothetical protein